MAWRDLQQWHGEWSHDVDLDGLDELDDADADDIAEETAAVMAILDDEGLR